MTPSSHPNSLHPIVVIPSRLAATRLPRKPLADIHGRPMIMHVWQRAVEADLGPVVVAAADREIADAVTAAGGHAVLTRPELASGSDRVFEAVEMIDPERRHDVVVNLQGDLPTLDPKAVRAVLRPLIDTSVDIATLVAPIADPRERDDENVVKAAVAFAGADTIGPALYFSRSPIPWEPALPTIISVCTPSAAPASLVSSGSPPASSNSVNAWNSFAPWRTACGSRPPWSTPFPSASIRQPTLTAPETCCPLRSANFRGRIP